MATRPRSQSKPVTIAQVAERAMVSKTTVSRYLNGRYDAFSDETGRRIQTVIEELNYRPNRIAQSLKARNSRVLGCMVGDIGSPFSSLIVKGINSVCMEKGYQLLLMDSGDDPQRERDGIRDLLESQVDGLIINTTGENDEYLLSLSGQGVPIVLADRSLAQNGLLDTVSTENYRSTYDCIARLRDYGYQRVGFFTQGNGSVTPRILRFNGYTDAMRERFGQQGEAFCFRLEDDADCVRALRLFREKYPGERLAAFAVNGMTLLYLLRGIHAQGIEIGPRFGVCGFDAWGWESLISPGITTIAQDSHQIGRRAAQLLLERIAGKGPAAPVYEQLPARLQLRGSTARMDGQCG